MKDTYCSYYTNSQDITSYMSAKLKIDDGDIVLEPSAGEGIFIDEILKLNKTIRIDALDINKDAIAVLKKKYENNTSVIVRETDTLLDEQLDMYSIQQMWLKQTDTLLDKQLDVFNVLGGHYSKVIGNPPYGAWQDYDKREMLKKKFAGHYVKETYSLFLLRCISVLKKHGRLSFIIPDTYLFLNLHARLREVLLTNTKIDEILIFPSKFFPGVSFGYSNLSIITLERCDRDEAINNTFNVIQGFKSSNEFLQLINSQLAYPKHLQVFKFKQKDVISNEKCRVILAEPEITSMLIKNEKKLGDVADVVTGFYTGNNRKFIRAAHQDVKGAKNYEMVDPNRIFQCASLHGIQDIDEGYIPYIKSASKQRYIRQSDEWFVRWDKNTVDFYNSDKKSRFQNSMFYFKTGIGIPMVKSSCIKAFLMKDQVFDQSIVGIFPKDSSRLLYILALMNSDVINNLIHTINPTANNSANYIKQLPYIEPPQAILFEIETIVEKILVAMQSTNYDEVDWLHKKVNAIVQKVYDISS